MMKLMIPSNLMRGCFVMLSLALPGLVTAAESVIPSTDVPRAVTPKVKAVKKPKPAKKPAKKKDEPVMTLTNDDLAPGHRYYSGAEPQNAPTEGAPAAYVPPAAGAPSDNQPIPVPAPSDGTPGSPPPAAPPPSEPVPTAPPPAAPAPVAPPSNTP